MPRPLYPTLTVWQRPLMRHRPTCCSRRVAFKGQVRIKKIKKQKIGRKEKRKRKGIKEREVVYDGFVDHTALGLGRRGEKESALEMMKITLNHLSYRAYYCLNMVLITLSTLLSVVVVNLYFHGSRTNVPRLFKKIMVDVFAYVFCMRAQLISPKEAAAANSATVYATNARDRRLADIKYDRVGMSEQQGDTQRQYATTNGNPGIPSVSESDVPPEVMSNLLPQFFSLEWEVKEIRRHLKCIAERMADKEEGEKKAREWKVVALVLDRLFFFLYLAVLVVSAFTLFETRLLQSEAVNDGLGQT
ncbi:hypothetical protein C0Q70_00854 [Pomacea canaliculata]|uniref:Neurotransmitter-gated ion-channel transmembrane domain-containing protein n=1 Tax=Pomacea canaliculata TaxID=400727 RepID=A0A2T7PXU3_POMCA|nr:hypothetical protein C0Q70_00854 [Pomacea canaliculata]